MRYNWSQRFFLIFHRMRELRVRRQAARKKNQAAGKRNLAALQLMFTASRLSCSSLNVMLHEIVYPEIKCIRAVLFCSRNVQMYPRYHLPSFYAVFFPETISLIQQFNAFSCPFVDFV